LKRNSVVLCVSFVAVVGYMAVVYWLSDMPSITMDIQDSIAHLLKRDVFEHCLEFIPLGLLTANLFSLLFRTRPTLHVSLAAFVSSTFYGTFDEFHQSIVPHRAWEFENSMFDVLGNAIGALIGIMLFISLYFIYKKGILKRARYFLTKHALTKH
jgi:VanZ family protein